MVSSNENFGVNGTNDEVVVFGGVRIKRIMPIMTSQDYLEKAFRRAKKKSNDREKIDSFKDTIVNELDFIVKNFPSIDKLPDFYKELIEYTIITSELKKSLAALTWASNKIKQLHKQIKDKRAFFGRVSSIMKQISKHLDFLEQARKKFDEFPIIKDMFTVCITGFPNVGKTTLLATITKSIPEIKPYPFTTKRINIGYLTTGTIEVQFLDTPGTLNRINKMNRIELQSFLAMKHVPLLIILVIDPTMDLKKQIKLLLRIEPFKKPILIFISKSDLVDDIDTIKNKVIDEIKSIKGLNRNYDIIIDKDELKEKVLKMAKEYYNKLMR